MLETLISILFSLAPVMLFLWGLIYLDSYKLVPFRHVARAIGAGFFAAGVALLFNLAALAYASISLESYVRVGAPIVEELCKAAWPLYLLRTKRIGFMVDAGVYGFATGAGFAVIENIAYLETIQASSPVVWVVRGFGTAVMHGGTTAIILMIAKNRMDIRESGSVLNILPGLAAGILIHALFNQFFFSPLMNTLFIVLLLPALMILVFNRSEQATRAWLGVGFDMDADLLKMVISGNIGTTTVGRYLHTLTDRFQPEVVVDLLCYLRIYLELAVQAKGILMMRDAGFDIPPAPDTDAKFREMEYLDRSIGRTGRLALHPFLRINSRELWQLNMLKRT